MQSDGFVLEQKPVFDWNHVPVGRVTTARRDPKTRATTQLVLTLSPEAQTQLGVPDATLEVPASLVFGVRRDAVTLDRSLSELKRIDFFASVLKK
ncbi:MAG TPA: hypothetical protein VNX21_07180 [Candidatus Thermoplasmatota archaeon]|nr:hypothetical protein [Candidatus Thermoplasmatota archaeon]